MGKLFLLTTVLLLVAYISVAQVASVRIRRHAITIPREFQNINVETYLKNKRAVILQLKCVIYNGPCDKIGKYFKAIIPEFITEQCRSCSREQRRQVGIIAAHVQQNYPKEWDDAVKKFQDGKVISADAIKNFETQFGG